MNFSHIVYNLYKIILNKKHFVMTSYFHNGIIFDFFEFLSTLARYTGGGAQKALYILFNCIVLFLLFCRFCM